MDALRAVVIGLFFVVPPESKIRHPLSWAEHGQKGVPPVLLEWDVPLSTRHRSVAASRGHQGVMGEQMPQDPNAIRINVTESYGNRAFESQLGTRSKWPSSEAPAANSGYRALAAQWRTRNPDESCCVLSSEYLVVTKKSSGRDLLSRVTEYEGFWPSLSSVVRQKPRQWAHTERRILFREAADSRRTVFIDCKTYVSVKLKWDFLYDPDKYPLTLTENFVNELKQLEAAYLTIRSPSNWRKTFLLQSYHACLNLLAGFLQEFSTDYVTARKRDYDTQHSKLLKWHIEKMAADVELYRQLSDTGNSIAENVDSLLEAIRVADDGDDDTRLRELTILGAELRRSCRDVQAQLAKFTDDLQHRLKFLELRRNVTQTDSVERLTLLATLFLPMSLAAGLLSMQSRFKDLGYLLYDFVGVVVLLGCLAMVALAFIIALSFARELDSRLMWYPLYRGYIRWILAFWRVVSVALFTALLLASFLVGMFKNVVLGGRFLGYGTIVIASGPVLLISTFVVGVNVWIQMTRRRKQKRRAAETTDLEREPVQAERGGDPGGSMGSSENKNARGVTVNFVTDGQQGTGGAAEQVHNPHARTSNEGGPASGSPS